MLIAPVPLNLFVSMQLRELGGRKVVVFEQFDEDSRVASIVLRASTNNVLDDLERAVDDGNY